MITVETNSLEKLAERFAAAISSLSDKAETGTEKAIHRGAMAIEESAKEHISGHRDIENKAVKTGILRGSITNQFFKGGGEPYAIVGTNIHYAPHVEYGTRKKDGSVKMRPRPFLRPAVEENIEKIKEEIAEAIVKSMK